MGGPCDIELLVNQTARKLLKQSWRIRLVSEVEKSGTVFFFEKTDFFNYVIDLFGAKAFNVPLKMVAESAAPPVTTAGGEIG